MMNPNMLLSEQCKIVAGLGPVTPSSSTPDYVSLKNYGKLTILIQGLNASTVTGSAITLLQASDVAATGEKALAFSTQRANIDCGATDTLVETAVTSNTFTTTTVNTKQFMHEITVDPEDLDIANNFDCVRVGTANAVNTTLSVTYILWPAKFAKGTPPSAILD